MLASGCSRGIGAGCPGAIRRGLNVVYSSASDVKSCRVCFHYRIVLTEFTSFALIGYEVIITNPRYALVGYFITSYPTRAHGIIVIYLVLQSTPTHVSLNEVVMEWQGILQLLPQVI